MKRLFSFLFLAAVMAVISLFLLLISKSPLPPPKNETLSPAGYESGQDLAQLARRFGVSVPYYSLSGSGHVTDATYPGGTARILSWSDQNGCTVRAVRPAAAASLLRDPLLTPTTECYRIADMVAAVFTGTLRNALYFGNTDAAYAVYFDASVPISALGTPLFTD